MDWTLCSVFVNSASTEPTARWTGPSGIPLRTAEHLGYTALGVLVAALIAAPRAWIGPALVIAVGAGLQLTRLDVVDVDLWGFLWPVVIILLGLAILLRLESRSSDAATVNSAVIWWGAERSTTSQEFTGGSLSAIMGGIELDLRAADIVDRAEISVFVWWGGVEITVPPTWRVRVEGLPLLGGWENKTQAPERPDAPELVVRVTAIMGGVEIHH